MKVILALFQLREFQEDDSKKEVCFPATLTKQERECIKLAAQEMGLRVEDGRKQVR